MREGLCFLINRASMICRSVLSVALESIWIWSIIWLIGILGLCSLRLGFFISPFWAWVVICCLTPFLSACTQRDIRKCAIKLWSFVVLKTSDFLTKRKFRDIEKLSLKIASLESHRKFNEKCLNIFIYIHASLLLVGCLF